MISLFITFIKIPKYIGIKFIKLNFSTKIVSFSELSFRTDFLFESNNLTKRI